MSTPTPNPFQQLRELLEKHDSIQALVDDGDYMRIDSLADKKYEIVDAVRAFLATSPTPDPERDRRLVEKACELFAKSIPRIGNTGLMGSADLLNTPVPDLSVVLTEMNEEESKLEL